MEGLKRSFIRAAIVLVVSTVVALFIIVPGLPRFRLDRVSEYQFNAALFFAGATGVSVWLASIYLTALLRSVRDRRLLHEAWSGAPPNEGERAAFVGTIETADPVRAPISGREVAAFRYEISQMRSGLDSRTKFLHFVGSGLVPLRLRTSSGSLPLSCFPHLEVAPIHVDRSEAIDNFNRYRRENAIEPPVPAGTYRGKPDLRNIGVHRFDREWSHREELDWKEADLTELSVVPGQHVTVFAHWSGQRGIIRDPLDIDMPILYTGDEVKRKLRWEVRRALIGMAVLLPIAAALIVAGSVYVRG
jgi:hypothetical protein